MLDFILRLQIAISGRFQAMGEREEGATAVEYGMMVALIAAVIVALVKTLGTQIKAAFQTIVTNLT